MDGFQSSSSGGVPKIQVFRPTWEEFKDFNNYIIQIEKTGAHRAGLAKVIPPKEWNPRADGYDMDIIGNIEIPAPISQVVQGKQGVYQQFNIQKNSMKVKELKRMAESVRYATPAHFDYEDLDRKYWRNISYFPPIYGADVSGSLTDPTVEEWNINKLGSILDYVNEDYGISIDGVNTAYLYFGMWKSSFAWHTEDMDLYSINYLHFGAPKSWYCIPPEHGARLERLANNFFPGNAKECPAYLRHKMTVISPMVLKNHSIPCNKIVQEAGEFMITFPYGYHAGFNHGFNCAESTNFASPRWVEYGKRATQCNCRPDMVKISMDTFVKRFQPERYDLWLQGKDIGPHPELPGRNSAAPHPSREEILCNKNNPDLPESFVEPSKKKAKRHLIHQQLDQEQQQQQEQETPIKVELEEPKPVESTEGNGVDHEVLDEEFESDEEAFEVMKDIYYKAGEMGSDGLEESDEESKRKVKKSSKRSKTKCVSSGVSSSTEVSSANVKHRRIKSEPATLTLSEQVVPKAKIPPPPSKMTTMFSGFRIPKKTVIETPSCPETDMNCWTEADLNASRILSSFVNNVKQRTSAESSNVSSIDSRRPDEPEFSKTRIQTPSASSHIKTCPVITHRSPSPSSSHRWNGSPGTLNSSTNHQVSPHREIKSYRSPSVSPVKVNKFSGMASSEERRSRKQKCPRINRAGVDSRDLSANLMNMWSQQKDWSLAVEADFNLLSSRQDPHCSICSVLRPAVPQRGQQPEPSSSPVLLPEELFGSDRTGTVSNLLRCSSCRVCVHAKCYGVAESTSAMNWLCQRCERSDESAKCCLCLQRGGALKSTTDSRWAHILCALCFPGVFFGQPTMREPIVVDRLAKESVVLLSCVFCSGWPDCSNVFYRGICLPCSGSPSGQSCQRAFHPTCGLVNGVQFTLTRDHQLTGSCCATTLPARPVVKKKIPDPLPIGQMVYANHPDERIYCSAVVTDKKEITYYEVDFADGTHSDDTFPEDIQNYNCKVDGPPPKGAAVDVLWSDNIHYEGYYRGMSTRIIYKLRFRDGSIAESERKEFYHPDQDCPKHVRDQLNKQSPHRTHHHNVQS